MKILSRYRKPAHFKMDFGVEGDFSADNQDEENNFETVADLLEESDFQIEKEDDLNNDVSFIYIRKILFVASRGKNNFRVVFVRKDFLQTCLSCTWETAEKDLNNNSVLVAINEHTVDLFPVVQSKSL